MLKIKDKTNLCFNRGDEIYLTITLVNETFKVGDKVQMNVVEKEHYENILFTKEFTVEEENAAYVINLTSDETKFGETLTKRGKNYWYEISLNDITLIGYDAMGPKILSLFPEAEVSE